MAQAHPLVQVLSRRAIADKFLYAIIPTMFLTKKQKAALIASVSSNILVEGYFVYLKTRNMPYGNTIIMIGVSLALLIIVIVFILFSQKYNKLLKYVNTVKEEKLAWVMLKENGTDYLIFEIDDVKTRIGKLHVDGLYTMIEWNNKNITVQVGKVEANPIRTFDGLLISQDGKVAEKLLLYDLDSNFLSRPLKDKKLDEVYRQISNKLNIHK